MSIAGWGLDGPFYLALPVREVGYLLLGVYLLILALSVRRPAIQLPRRPQRLLLAALGLGLASLVFAGAFTVQLSPGSAALAPLGDGGSPRFPLFGALPWMLAAGFAGDFSAVAVAALGGLARGGWGVQRLLTPFGIAAQAAAFAWLIRRPYAEWPGRLARRPLPSALVTGLAFGLLGTLENFAYAPGDGPAALDQTVAGLGPALLAPLLELGLAGALTTALRAGYAQRWRAPQQLVMGPYSRSLAARLVTVVVSLGVAGGAVLTYGNWLLSRTSAERMISDQMSQTALQVAETIPFFVQTGRTQIRSVAESLPPVEAASELSAEVLGEAARERGLFTRLAVLDLSGVLWASWPERSADFAHDLEQGVQTGVPQELLLAGQFPAEGVQLVFLTPLTREAGTIGMLAGWTDLDRSPILEPVNARLEAYSPGEIFVVDSRGRVLMHSDPNQWLRPVGYPDPSGPAFFDAADSLGRRARIYSLPVEGYPWRVLVSTPRSAIDALALSTTGNLFVLLASLGGLLIVAVHWMARRLTRPLRDMANTAEAIALGDLDRQVPPASDDEIGRLAGSFERMRQALKARLGELNLLLAASRRMAESFDLSEALPLVLNRIRDLIDVDCVRLVLESEGQLEAYQAGSGGRGWERLDPGILELTRGRGQFSLENPSRAGAVLDLGAVSDGLEALMAYPVKQESHQLGALWIGHGRPRAFSKAEIRLLSILAGQLAISLENVGLYRRAERERSRLLAILGSTPDAVIVTDDRGRVSLANPAADAVLTVKAEQAIGKPIGDLVRAPELAALFTDPLPPSRSVEVTLEGGRVLYASASDVPGGQLGRVGVLSDITHYKVLDTLKSEFVSTVSHDLRSPLALVQGYASMVSHVGTVNPKQQELLDKVTASVNRMTKLVDDLLDLGRIESGVGHSLAEVEIPSVLQEVLSTYRPLALNKQVALEVQLGSNLEPVQADPVLMRQAIGNLVDNAIKYSPAGERVLLRAEQLEGRQVIQVQDRGPGIAAADQPRLFEKFFRVGEGRGSGLGLAIVKSIVEQHQGRVSVESRLGRGSTFTLAFPMRSERVRAAA